MVNDLLRVVRQARRDAGLQVSDRIVLNLAVSDGVWAAVQDRADRVAAETLSVGLERAGADGSEVRDGTTGTVGDGESVRVRVGGPSRLRSLVGSVQRPPARIRRPTGVGLRDSTTDLTAPGASVEIRRDADDDPSLAG